MNTLDIKLHTFINDELFPVLNENISIHPVCLMPIQGAYRGTHSPTYDVTANKGYIVLFLVDGESIVIEIIIFQSRVVVDQSKIIAVILIEYCMGYPLVVGIPPPVDRDVHQCCMFEKMRCNLCKCIGVDHTIPLEDDVIRGKDGHGWCPTSWVQVREHPSDLIALDVIVHKVQFLVAASLRQAEVDGEPAYVLEELVMIDLVVHRAVLVVEVLQRVVIIVQEEDA